MRELIVKCKHSTRDRVTLTPPDVEGEVALHVRLQVPGEPVWLDKERARELANWLFAYLHT